MYYKGLTGSRQFNINIENSDTDYSVITKDIKNNYVKSRNDDFHYLSPTEVISYIFEDDKWINAWKVIGTLFSKPVIETEFSKYLLEIREELIRSNLPRFGKIMLDYSKVMNPYNNGKIGESPTKRTAYAIIFLNAYINYATKEISFEEAFKLSDELTEFVRGIRLETIPCEIQMEKLNSMMEEAKNLKRFYDKEPDLITFNRIKSNMKILLNIE